MKAMNSVEVEKELANCEGWQLDGEVITRTWKFVSFPAALEFVNQVGEEAEQMDHHPDILVKYNQVTLSLSTHDAGGITKKDFELAKQCNRIATVC